MKKQKEIQPEFDEELENTKYAINIDDDSDRSVALLIADRRNYSVKQADNIQNVLNANLKQLIKDISIQAADSPEYLLPDMPLKEAVFRTILANKNKSISAVAISQTLKNLWPVNTYPRDISPKVIQSLLGNMTEYPIKTIVPAEPDSAK